MELHPDLRPFLVTTSVGPMLQHPLIHQLFFGTEMEIGWANQAYEQKTVALHNAITTGDWNTAIALHERPYRVDVLARVPRTAPDYWNMVATWWCDTEFPSNRGDVWTEILHHPDVHLMMDPDERAVFDSLPDTVTVHRGCGDDSGAGVEGLSWTLSREKAEWFARRFTTDDSPGRVLTRTVPKSVIAAYLARRGEDEIIILP